MNLKHLRHGAALGVIFLGSFSAYAQLPPEPRDDSGLGPPTVTINASSEVAVMPDQAVVRLGVLAEAAEAGDAQDQVNTAMRSVLDAVTALGFPDRALRTENLSLQPIYGEARPVPADRGRGEGPRVTGYRASSIVSVEVDELARIGEVVDAAIGAGANQLQGIAFRVRNDAGVRAEAMRLAVEEARRQADAVAEALQMRVAGVREVIAGGYDVNPPVPYMEQRLAADIASTPVQPGRVEVSASVTVTFELSTTN